MLTSAQIAKSCGCKLPRAEAWTATLNSVLPVFAIDTPARAAAFLAQVAHESARLNLTREIWGPTPAQLRYERSPDAPWSAHAEDGSLHRNSKAFSLGNSETGDGFRFRGRGLIQTTGRGNHQRTRDGLRKFLSQVPDFEIQPELLEGQRWAAYSAAWYWHDHGLNALADSESFLALTRRINGGTNGYDDRLALWAGAKAALA